MQGVNAILFLEALYRALIISIIFLSLYFLY